MRSFSDIYQRAVDCKGGEGALQAILDDLHILPATELAAIGDDRWLSRLAKVIFQAGFNWKVIENKWPGFEQAFQKFNPQAIAYFSDEDIDRLLSDKAIVRNGQKITSVCENAQWFCRLAEEHGSAAAFFAHWPVEQQVGLMAIMQKNGSRAGGNSGQYFLRFMGKESFILSRDVVASLIREGVIDKPPGSKTALAKCQQAFNDWKEETGLSMTHLSRILAASV